MKLLIIALLFSLSTQGQTKAIKDSLLEGKKILKVLDTTIIVAIKIVEFNKYLENNVSMAQYKTLTPEQTLQIFLNWIEPKKKK